MSVSRSARGVTLMEILVASVLATVVVLGIGSFEGTRVRIGEDLRQRSAVEAPDRVKAALAVLHLMKRLENADRVVLRDTGGTGAIPPATPTTTDVLVRTPIMLSDGALPAGTCTGTTPPDPRCFDIAANYRWDEYRLNAGAQELKFYTNVPPDQSPAPQLPCPVEGVLARKIRSVSIRYGTNPDTTTGTQPTAVNLVPNQDSNVLNYAVEWYESATSSQVFYGGVTNRAQAYTNVSTGLSNPGGTDISRPRPGSCGP